MVFDFGDIVGGADQYMVVMLETTKEKKVVFVGHL
jgi:hypothetical protein